MRKRLPSLVALRTFEAAARLLSFKKAAEELAVTSTAVSHQIRSLEAQLETPLFTRKVRGIELTQAGADIAPAVSKALDDMVIAIERATSKNNTLTISTTPSFATLFLVPHLMEFYQKFPHYSVQLHTSTQMVDLHLDRHVDLVIRYGGKPQRGLNFQPLFSESFYAYIAPSLALQELSIDDLTLIQTDWQQRVLPDIHWNSWLSAAGLPARESNIIGFAEESYVLQAAIAGKGIALASSILAKDLVDRNLLQLYQGEVGLQGQSYNLVGLSGSKDNKKVIEFSNWLQSLNALK